MFHLLSSHIFLCYNQIIIIRCYRQSGSFFPHFPRLVFIGRRRRPSSRRSHDDIRDGRVRCRRRVQCMLGAQPTLAAGRGTTKCIGVKSFTAQTIEDVSGLHLVGGKKKVCVCVCVCRCGSGRRPVRWAGTRAAAWLPTSSPSRSTLTFASNSSRTSPNSSTTR